MKNKKEAIAIITYNEANARPNCNVCYRTVPFYSEKVFENACFDVYYQGLDADITVISKEAKLILAEIDRAYNSFGSDNDMVRTRLLEADKNGQAIMGPQEEKPIIASIIYPDRDGIVYSQYKETIVFANDLRDALGYDVVHFATANTPEAQAAMYLLNKIYKKPFGKFRLRHMDIFALI